MNATAHPFTPEEIMAFLDGELPVDRAQSIAAHTESCPSCHGVMQEIQQTKNALASWRVPTSRSTAENRIQSALARSVSFAPSASSTISRGSSSKKQWILGLALTSAVAFLLVIFIPNLLRSGMPGNEAAAVYRRQQGLQAGVPVDELAEQDARMRFGKDKSVAPRTDQQSKVFNNRIQSDIKSELTPGVAKDSNGLFHGLGDRAQNAFSIDGQPISDQQSRVFPNPMIARTVSLSIVAKDFDSSRKSLEAILARHNGYSASLSVSTPPGAARSIEASLRIPAPALPAALSELRTLGRVELETQSGEEVTPQHADLARRLRIAHETENRFLTMLKERTGDVYQTLQAEQAIARVRGEIEQMEAEQKNLEHRVDFATIDLKLSEEYKAQLSSPAPSVSTLLRNALINGLRTAADSVLSLVLFFSESGPVVLLWLAILAIPARQLWRRYRRAAAAI